jgi:hypothetical protein
MENEKIRPVPHHDSDLNKGAAEPDNPEGRAHDTSARPDLHGNLSDQLAHRSATRQNDALTGDNGTDFPEPGSSPEHSGERSS